MTTPKTWEEVVEIAARGAWEGTRSADGIPWDRLDELDKAEERNEQAAALRALRAAGLAVVPRDCTDEIAEAIAGMANCCGGIAESSWRAALSTGELAPPDKGEG